jgi:hypothetical protein
VGPRTVLDAVVKRKIPSPRRESNPRNPDRPARRPVAIPTELSQLPRINFRSAALSQSFYGIIPAPVRPSACIKRDAENI